VVKRVAIVACSFAMLASGAHAGTYLLMEFFARQRADVPPWAIVHPPGYNGSGGGLEVRVCVDPSPPQNPGDPANNLLAGPLEWALGVWNALEPMVNNCGGRRNCEVWEDGATPGGTIHLASTLLHEIGHCAMGLGHPNLRELQPDNPIHQPFFQAAPPVWYSGVCNVDNNGCCHEHTSFTSSINAKDISLGDSAIRGEASNNQTNDCPTSGLATAETSAASEPRDWLQTQTARWPSRSVLGTLAPSQSCTRETHGSGSSLG
jgi:hypothetical protein